MSETSLGALWVCDESATEVSCLDPPKKDVGEGRRQ